MTSEENLYCKIFVDSNMNEIDQIKMIASITAGEISKWTVVTDGCEIDVIKNDDYNKLKSKDASDGFLYYRYYLDIEPFESVEKEKYIFEIGLLIQGLWNNKCKAVAACDFEDQLPMKGGIGS